MSKFSEFAARNTGPQEPEHIVIDGSFGCQTCFEQVDEAKFYHADKMLVWICSHDHKSYIEEFNL